LTTKDEDFEAIREACPYNIPRKDEKTGRIVNAISVSTGFTPGSCLCA
jgi:hypothetical protein